MEWDVPGLDPVELVGFGTDGEVWRAVDRGTGQLVAVRVVDTGGSLDEVRRRAALLRAVRSEHLVRVRLVTETAVVLDHAGGGSLASLVVRRGTLTPGEVVTALAPVALVLAEAHDRGLVHGRLSAREVLLTPAGKPLLDGLALSFLYDARSTPADDVHALARLALELLADRTCPPGLAALAVHADTTAAELGQALLTSCPAEPLAGLSPPDPPVLVTLPPPVHEEPRRSRRWLLVVPVVIALGAVGVRSQSQQPLAKPSPATPSSTATPLPTTAESPAAAASPTAAAEPGWQVLFERLDQARAAAFAAADPLALAQVYVAGSAAFLADRQALDQLTAAGLTARGLRHEVRSLRTVQRSALQVELHVTESLAAHDLVSRDGDVEQRVAGPSVARVVVLRRTSSGWRVEEVRNASPAAR